MNIFVVRMYFSRIWDENTSWWNLVHQILLYYILTMSKLHPNYENVHPNYEKGHPYYEKLHPIYEQTTSQLRGRRSENFKKCLISFKWGIILGKYGHRGHYFWPSFVCTEFRFALIFPFNKLQKSSPTFLETFWENGGLSHTRSISVFLVVVWAGWWFVGQLIVKTTFW